MFFLWFMSIFLTVLYFNNKKEDRLSKESMIVSGMMKDFTQYYTILQFHMEKSYEMIFKDRISIYSIDGYKPNEGELDAISKDFVKLVLKFLGYRMQKQLELLYGDQRTLLRNITQYFNSKFENDSVRQAALEHMVIKNEEESEKS